RSGVAELNGSGGAGAVYGIGESLESRQSRLTHHDLVGRTLAVLRDCAVSERREPNATLSHGAVEGHESVRHEAARRHPFERSGLHEAVAERDGTEGRGGEGVGA